MIPRGAHFSPGDRFLRELDGTYQFCIQGYYSTVVANVQEDFYTEINFQKNHLPNRARLCRGEHCSPVR